MTRLRALVFGTVAALGAAAATPSMALTYVHFSFTAGGTAAHGTYTLDCPPGAGPCAILAMTGTFGTTPIALAQPPYPAGSPTPDNLLTRPDFEPTHNGADFWPEPTVTEESWRIWKAIGEQLELERRNAADVERFLIDDYAAYVPEPAGWAMLLLGFFGLGAALRLRRGHQPRRA